MKRTTMPRRVYFIHSGNLSGGLAADFFIRRKRPVSEDEAEAFGVDYRQPDCPYVKQFLLLHPDYQLLGSTDNQHLAGWGMGFEGFSRIDAPGNERKGKK